MTQEIRYQDYQKLICKIAHKYAKRTSFPFDELMSEGNEIFCKCLQSFDPEKSCFATYLYHALNQEFLNRISLSKIKKRYHYNDSPEIEILPCRQSSPEQTCIFADMMAQLSQDAKFICKIILETPLDLIDQIKSKNKKIHSVFKNDLKKYITTKYNWIPWRCEKAFAEIGGLFQ